MKLRVYVDTSVFGGCLDEEFAEASGALLQRAQRGEVLLLVSDLLADELSEAPNDVRAVLDTLPGESLEMVQDSEEAERLRDAYLAAGVVGPASAGDAHHVALATVARADVLVSWNFRHIVHVERIRKFNAVNLNEGYGLIDIRSPLEVA